MRPLMLKLGQLTAFSRLVVMRAQYTTTVNLE